MMRLLANEFIKVFGKKSIWLILLGAMCLNGILLYVNESSRVTRNNFYSTKHYKNIYVDLQGKSNQEALKILQDEFKTLEILMQLTYMENDILFQYNSQNGMLMDINEDELKKLEEIYKSGSYLKYTDDIWKEYWLYRDVISEITLCESYADYLNKIDEAAETLSQLPIFEEKDSFSYRNILKTPEAFNHLKGNKLYFGPSNGIKMATEFFGTDMLAVVLLIMIIASLITREKEMSQLILLKSTFLGRKPLVIAKLATAYLGSFIITILLYGVNFFVAYHVYGFGSLNRLIQSVSGYMGSNLNITILHYFIMFLIAKLIIYILFTSIAFLFAVLAKDAVQLYLTLVSLLAVSAVAYYNIDQLSYLSIFKYLNIISFLNTYSFFKSYLNINFFDMPINYILISFITIIAKLIIAVTVSVLIFCRQKTIDNTSRITEVLKYIRSKLQLKYGYRSSRLFWHECYKIFIGGKSLLFLLVYAAVTFVTYKPLSENLSTLEDFYYKQYMLELEGEVNEDKLRYIEEEEARLSEAYNNMMQLMEEADISPYIMESYQNILAPYKALQEVKMHTDYLKTKNGSQYLYDSGYKILTGEGSGRYKDIQLALQSVIMTIVCIVYVYTVEYQTGSINLIKASYKGRLHTFLCKLGISVIILTVIYFTTYAPYFFNVLQAYGVRALSAPAYSMKHLSEIPKQISILKYLIFISVMRYIGLILTIFIIFWLSVRLKSVILTLVACICVLVLPLLFSLLGISGFDYVLLNPFLLGNVF